MNHADEASSQSSVVALSSSASDTRLRGGILVLARGVWIAIALFELGLFVLNLLAPVFGGKTMICPFSPNCGYASTTLQAVQHAQIPLATYNAYLTTLGLIDALITIGLSVLLFWRRFDHPVSMFASFVFLLFGATAIQGDTSKMPLVIDLLAFWLLTNCLLLCLGLFLVSFPDGRFVPRWSWLIGCTLVVQGVFFELPASSPWNITNWPAPLSLLVFAFAWGSPIAIQIYRYMRVSSPAQRQQTRWVIFGLASFIVLFLVSIFMEALFPSLSAPDSLYPLVSGSLVPSFCFLFIPVSITLAILHAQLWDIDIIIKRTLVYGILTVSVIGLYILIVVGLGTLLRARNDLVLSLLATGLIAVFFQPLRARVQRAVNRLTFGERENPSGVLSHLGSRLDAAFAPDAVLRAIVETIAQALKLPYAALFLSEKQALTLAAEHGKPVTTSLTMPLTYQGEAIGELHLAPRTPGEAFAPADLHVLGEVARQAGLAVHAVRLAADLQRARERLVLAREEERRRIRRDLHDGIGPTLASFSQRLDTVGTLLHHEPDVAIELLDQLKSQVTVSIADIRRLVYALRPPVLDELGLVPALQEHISLLQRPPSLSLTFEAPKTLPPLPAATEVAVYRIALEALTNVERHAQARTCQVSLSLEEAGFLCLDIADDGRGVSAADRAGVGLMSMRERAEELGGQCHIGAGPQGGTLVHARLPVPQEERADRSPDM